LESGKPPQTLLPLLQTIILQDLKVGVELLTPLASFLRSRNNERFGIALVGDTHKDRHQVVQLIIRNCILQVLYLEPPREFEVEELIFSTFVEFDQFTTLLARHGFYTSVPEIV